MKIILAAPRGFCAGVNMAVGTLARALEMYGAPLFVYHEIVHNNWIVKHFENKGVVFIHDIDEAPEGSCLLFSAHGVSPEIRERAEQRRLLTIDATCPLVNKVHQEATRFSQQGYSVFLIGRAGHDEVVGTLGVAPGIQLVESEDAVDTLQAEDPVRTAYVMQTTLSIDDAMRIVDRLRERFPNIVGPAKSDICYATQNRQEAVREFIAKADVVLVLGSQSSSNSKRLAEVALNYARHVYLIDGPLDIAEHWFSGHETVLITAGASSPEILVQQCVRLLREHHDATVEEFRLLDEHAHFSLPAELRPSAAELRSCTANQAIVALTAPDLIANS